MKTLIALLFTIMPLVAFGQEDVTKFLGIPVDGFKSDMIRKLQAKGYTLEKTYDGTEYLTGEFNGEEVNIYIVTDNNKVWRIMVADQNERNEEQIRLRFNNLFKQFVTNGKYIPLNDFTIPDTEDISYEMLVNKKQYGASFFQLSTDTATFNKEIREVLLSKYTPEQCANPTQEMAEELNAIVIEKCSHKNVWFLISEIGVKYCIFMYYDNEKNRANGEEL